MSLSENIVFLSHSKERRDAEFFQLKQELREIQKKSRASPLFTFIKTSLVVNNERMYVIERVKK